MGDDPEATQLRKACRLLDVAVHEFTSRRLQSAHDCRRASGSQ